MLSVLAILPRMYSQMRKLYKVA